MRSWIGVVHRGLRPQSKISFHDFHPPPVVDDDQDDGDESNHEDGDDHRGGGGGGGVGGGGGEGRQLDRPVDHLQAAVDALRADAAKSEVAGVEVVRTLARRAYGGCETGVVDITKRTEQLTSQAEPISFAETAPIRVST